MSNKSDFLALVEAAADLEDLQDNRFFVLQEPSNKEEMFPLELPRRAAKREGGSVETQLESLKKWALNSEANGRLCLRNPSRLPHWARGLQRMIVQLSCTCPAGHGSLLSRIVEPSVIYARDQLRFRLRHEDHYSFPPNVMHCFERQLQSTLERTVKSCLDLHFEAFSNAYRFLYRARSDVSLAIIERAFIGEHAGERLVSLLKNFPALAKIWWQLISDWLDKITELASRFQADRRAITRAFFGGLNPGDVLGITINISDHHHHGRETMILRFRGGRVVYKPRSGQSEADWFSLLCWVNRQGFAPPLRTIRILLRENYCWVEFIEHQSCASKRDAHKYYRRAGGLACAAHLLGAIDCHRDNLIAVRDQPVLIDTETLFHPESRFAPQGFNGSVIRTGLLPISKRLLHSGNGLSALGGVVRGRHTPTLRGKVLVTSTYSTDVLHGFRDMWDLIGNPCTPTSAAFRRRLRRLIERRWRRLYCSTRRYLEIRDRSLAPDSLISGMGRSRRIATELIREGVSAPTILEEISALSRFDVPYFMEIPREMRPRANMVPLSTLLTDVRDALFRA